MPTYNKFEINKGAGNPNSFVFLGDLIRAYHDLAPTNEATAEMIAGALGFEWRKNIVSTSTTSTEIQMTPESKDSPDIPKGQIKPGPPRANRPRRNRTAIPLPRRRRRPSALLS